MSYTKENICTDLRSILAKLKNLREDVEITELDDIIKNVESLVSKIESKPAGSYSKNYRYGDIRFLASAYLAKTSKMSKTNIQETMVNSIKQNILNTYPDLSKIEVSKVELVPSCKQSKFSKYGKEKKSFIRRAK